MSKRKSNFRDKVISDTTRHQQEGSKYGYLNLPKGVRMFNIEEDTRKVTIDILPYVVTDPKHPDRNDGEEIAVQDGLWYKRPFKVHRGIGSENKSFVCPTSIGKHCPICEWIQKRMKEGADWEEMKELSAKARNLYVVVPLDSKKHEQEPYIWDMSRFLFQDMLDQCIQEEPENGIFPDLEDGLSLEIKLRWKKFGKNVFPETRDIAFLQRQPYDDKILDDVPNLDELLIIMSYEELERELFQVEDDDNVIVNVNDTTEKDEPPVRERRRDPVKKDEGGQRTTHTVRRKPPIPTESEKENQEERHHQTKEDIKNECPYGFHFGVDTDKKDECYDCKVWDPCMDKKDELKNRE